MAGSMVLKTSDELVLIFYTERNGNIFVAMFDGFGPLEDFANTTMIFKRLYPKLSPSLLDVFKRAFTDKIGHWMASNIL